MQGALSDCDFKDGEMDGDAERVGGGSRGVLGEIICVLALLEAVTVVGPLTL